MTAGLNRSPDFGGATSGKAFGVARKVSSNSKHTLLISLLEKGNNTFIRFNEAVSILRKILVRENENFSKLVSSRKPFGITTDAQLSQQQIDSVKIYAYPNDGFVRRNEVKSNIEWIDCYKVYISYAYGERGDFPYFVIGKPFLGEPNTCCSETYLVIAPNEQIQYCMNVIKYLKTKFLRFLVLLKKNTQHATSISTSVVRPCIIIAGVHEYEHCL